MVSFDMLGRIILVWLSVGLFINLSVLIIRPTVFSDFQWHEKFVILGMIQTGWLFLAVYLIGDGLKKRSPSDRL
jgi:hypothetical protein